MAKDRALVENAQVVGRPTFRVYGWKPRCISIGHHQRLESIDLDRCGEDGVDVVRRPTGGRAVFHAEEVTYSVVIPKDSVCFRQSVTAVYNLISRGLVCGIQKLGVPAALEKRSVDLGAHYRTPLAASCFSTATRHEVVVGGRKLVGSAQRRLRGGILQHGSILRGDAHLDLPNYLREVRPGERSRMRGILEEKTISVGEYLRRTVTYEEVVWGIREGMEETFCVAFDEEGLTEVEEELVCSFWRTFSILSNGTVLA